MCVYVCSSRIAYNTHAHTLEHRYNDESENEKQGRVPECGGNHRGSTQSACPLAKAHACANTNISIRGPLKRCSRISRRALRVMSAHTLRTRTRAHITHIHMCVCLCMCVHIMSLKRFAMCIQLRSALNVGRTGRMIQVANPFSVFFECVCVVLLLWLLVYWNVICEINPRVIIIGKMSQHRGIAFGSCGIV